MPAGADQTLLERDEPLAILTDAVAAGGMIVIDGPAGIGKTTLVRRLAAGVDAVWLGAWRPLPPSPAALLSTVDAPRLVVFEDVHAADPATLNLLRFLGSRLDRAAIVATSDAALDDPAPETTRLTLAPLSLAATMAMVGASDLDPVRVFERTGGNPFFIEAILAAGTLPATVEEAVLARLSPVAPSTRSALEAAAVAGSRLEPAVLAGILDQLRVPRWTIRDALMSGFLRRDGVMFEFWHDLARAAILDTADPSRRVLVHDAIFLALQRIQPYSEHRLRAHAEAAGRTRDVGILAARADQRASGHRLALSYDQESQRQFWTGNPAAATELAAKALSLSGSLDLTVSAQISHAGARLLAGDLTAIDDLRPHVAEARALLYLGWLPTLHRHYANLEPVLHQGLSGTARLGRTYWNQLLAGAQLSLLLDTGRWPEAEALATRLLTSSLTLVAMQAAAALTRLNARRGTPDEHLVDTLRDLAKRHPKADAYTGATPALAEAAWLSGNPHRVHDEALTRAVPHNPWWHGELAYWCHRAGTPLPAAPMAEPYRLALLGDWQAAANWWQAHHSPYQSALARTESPDPATVQSAIDTLNHLGAPTAATQAGHRLQELSAT